MNKRLEIQMLNAVFALAERQGVNLCYCVDDATIYEVRSKNNNGCTLLPLNGNDAPIFHFDVGGLLFRYDIALQSDKIRISTENNGLETDEERNENSRETDVPTETERKPNGELSEMPWGVIGAGKVNLPKINGLYTGEIAAKCIEIETLLQRIIDATNKPQTISKMIDNYSKTKQFAKAGNLWELSRLAEKLQGTVKKQMAISAANDTMQARKQARRKMLFSFALSLLLVGVYLFWNNADYDTSKDTNGNQNAPPTITTQTVATSTVFDAAVSEWETKHNRRIYPKGRECLQRACRGITDKQKIMQIIDNNMQK